MNESNQAVMKLEGPQPAETSSGLTQRPRADREAAPTNPRRV